MMPAPAAAGSNWIAAIRCYLIVMAVGNLDWEIVQLPLYTLWREGSARSILWAVFHCTAGDLVIGSVALTATLAIIGDKEWPHGSAKTVFAGVIVIGVGYAVVSEYLNAIVRRSWAYTDWMPVLPWLGTGAAPLAQWVTIPSIALGWVNRRANAVATTAS